MERRGQDDRVTTLLATVTAGKVGLYLAVVVVGVLSGILSALLGVGGAVVTTPAVRFMGATPIEAVGSTVPAILPGAISGSWRYAKEGLVEWRTALGLGAAGALFAIGGAVLSEFVDGRVLMLLTAALMLWSGISVARGGRKGPAPFDPPVPAGVTEAVATAAPSPATVLRDVPRHSIGTIAGLGAVAGFVAGLLGVGGGIVMVPILTGPLKFPVRAATASSLVAVAIFSLPALVTHAVLGHINWFFATALMIGVVPGAQIGASLTIRSSERTIRLAFGVFIVLMALVFAATQLLVGS
jgi:uncharacterized membrane protein YfcA